MTSVSELQGGEPLGASTNQPVPGDMTAGLLGRAILAVYWYLILTVLLALAALPTIVAVFIVGHAPSAIPLMGIAAVFVGPALSAGIYTARARESEHDPVPARAYWRGYRVNFMDVVKPWAAYCVFMSVILFVLTHSGATGLSRLHVGVLIAVGLTLTTWALHTVAIASLFNLRTMDVARLASYYLFRMKMLSAGVLSLVIVAGAVQWLGTLVLALASGLWVGLWYRNNKPMIVDITERFTVHGAVG